MSGWIRLHRNIRVHWIYDEKPFSKYQAWTDILLSANHKDNKVMIGNELIDVKRGSFVTSELKLADRWGWSKTKVRSFLELLEKDKMIEKTADRKKTTLTVVNYEIWQGSETAEEPPKYHEKTIEKLKKDTNKNDKNVENDNKDIYSEIFEFWNSKEIIQHRKLTGKMKTKIKTTLKDYDVDTLKEIILTYAEIIHDDKYYFTYKWSLEDFLQRGLKQFENSEVAKQNYLDKRFDKTLNQNTAIAKKTRFHMKEQRSDSYSNDDLESVMERKRRDFLEKSKKEKR